MRRTIPSTGEQRAAVQTGGRRRAPIASAIALLVFVASLFATAPRWPEPAADGIGAVAAADCRQHDRRWPAGDAGGGCHAIGLCCAAGCDGSATLDVRPPRAAARRAQPSIGAALYVARENFLALAGWASAWSSRAPPGAA